MKNLYKKITIAFFAVFLAAMPILTLIFLSPEKTPFSENENRYLAAFPELNLKTYKEETFMEGFDEWISDRFYGREDWIALKNKTDSALGKTENNGVFVENDMMMQIWRDFDEELYNKNLKAINDFVGKHPEIPAYFMLVPNAQEIYGENIPKYAEVGSQKEFIDRFYSELKGFEGTVDAYSALVDRKGSYIYYRTDHHWTSYGAFTAYEAAAPVLDYDNYRYDSFTVEHADNGFRGTLFSRTLDFEVTPDVIDYYTLTDNEPSVKVSVYKDYDPKTGEVTYDEYDSMYFRSFLQVKDKYASFLGQNSPLVTVVNENAKSDRSILIIKDSYAHSIVPFLSKEYKTVTMIDYRYINTDFQLLTPLQDYDQLLFLYNVITFSEDKYLVRLNQCK
ncbi:MAG: DHHW family protein [Bacteroides sp.]|nr:DHHW family protein [Bacteroides sp.]